MSASNETDAMAPGYEAARDAVIAHIRTLVPGCEIKTAGYDISVAAPGSTEVWAITYTLMDFDPDESPDHTITLRLFEPARRKFLARASETFESIDETKQFVTDTLKPQKRRMLKVDCFEAGADARALASLGL